jgi:hypothetical protein
VTTFAIVSAVIAVVAIGVIIAFMAWEKKGGPHG